MLASLRLTAVRCLSSLLVAATLLAGCDRSPNFIAQPFPAHQPQANLPKLSPLPPLPQDPQVQVYFNQSRAATYLDPYRQQPRYGDNLEQIIIDTIATAQTSLEVAVQELRLPGIAQAIAERHRAGVRVRVIIENTYNQSWLLVTPADLAEMDERKRSHYENFRKLLRDLNGDGTIDRAEQRQADSLLVLADAGVPLLDDAMGSDLSAGSGLMHHKFVVADDRTVIVASANFTPSGTHGDFDSPSSRGNANNLLRIDSPALAKMFTQEFNLMWGDGPGGAFDSKFGLQKPPRPPQQVTVGNSQIAVQFAPISQSQPWDLSANGLISRVLATATASVDLMLFVFSEQAIADTLETVRDRGVQIRTLIDSQFAFRDYSEGLDMLGKALPGKNCQYEAGNRPWRSPITTVGIADIPQGDVLHHKVAIVDDRTVLAGSHNWSPAASHTNDETLIAIQNPTVAAHFHREFERLYDGAQLGLPDRVQQQIAERQQACASATVPPTLAPTLAPATSATGVREKINLNTASLAELESLPGVGPALAQRIVDARPFSSLEDLNRVSGIGDKTLQELQDRVTW